MSAPEDLPEPPVKADPRAPGSIPQDVQILEKDAVKRRPEPGLAGIRGAKIFINREKILVIISQIASLGSGAPQRAPQHMF